VNDEMRDLHEKLGLLSGRVRDHDVLLAGHDKVAADLAQIREQLADIQMEIGLGDGQPKKSYKPHSNPRWWDLGPDSKEAEVGRLRGWYDDIARRFLGAKGVPECVLEHDVTLLLLDAACEAWKTLWLPENRTAKTAAAQCEYLTRIWPSTRAEMIRVISGCSHQSGIAGFDGLTALTGVA